MQARPWHRFVQAACALSASAAAVWQIATLARLYLSRFRHPMDIEWLEGAALYQAWRVMKGQSTYGPPQNGYLPLAHPPGYPTFLGLVGHITGIDYPIARTLSILLFAGASALVAREIARHEESRFDAATAALVAVGCAAAGVPLLEGFYDLVRADILALFLCVLAAAIAARDPKPRPRRIALLALVMTAALYTRFPAVFILVGIAAFVLVRNRRAGLSLALTGVSACGLVLVAIQYASKGWFWMYTVGMLQDHHVERSRFGLGLALIHDHAPFALALPLVAIGLAVRRKLSARGALFATALACALPAALLPFAKVGGFSNDFMPVAFLIGPAAVFVASDLARAFAARPALAASVRSACFLGLGAFLVLRAWSPRRFVPTEQTVRRAIALNERVKQLDGGVIIPRAPFLPIRNGHATRQFSDMPYLDALWSGFTGLRLGAYLDRARARWAIVTGTEVPYTAAEIAARYQVDRPLRDMPGMVTGERVTLRHLLRWSDDETNARVVFDFEEPVLDGWRTTGDAFRVAEAPTAPPAESPLSGAHGRRYVTSLHPKLGDEATGRLFSPPFTIDRRRLSLRVGGGRSSRTRVELRVDGAIVKKASGLFEYPGVLVKVVWDVRSYQGKQAELVLVDEDTKGSGRLHVDRVILY